MRHLIASIPTASTRTLVAAFMAATFALLVLLPAFGQTTFDRTDGRISSGGLSVGVFDDIADAQLEKNVEDTSPTYPDEIVYLPVDNPQAYLVATQGLASASDTAYLANGLASPQQTFFGETLWVSNDPVNDEYDTNGVRTGERGAYNTILITAESDRVTPNADGCAVATVRTARGNNSITVQMAATSQTDGKDYYQAFVRILDPLAVNEDGDPLHTSSNGPTCADYGTGVMQDDTAAILARHGDRIVIDVEGAGSVSLEVDGEGPDVTDITPEDLSYVPSRSLDFSFVVRDDDAGLRHDGELVITQDGDYTQVNRDRDHATTGEPLSLPSGGQISVNGEAAEIDLKVWDKDANFGTADDITDSGRWRLVGNRPGVAYSFLADTNDLDEGTYYLEVSAFDRAGNKTVSDALDDDDIQPYLFTVDDTDPSTVEAWTGIAYEMNDLGGYEVADRSWIMVEFTEPVRDGVNPERIAVAGHEVVSVFQPQEFPDPERLVVGRDGLLPGAQRITFAPPAPRAAASLAPQAQTTCPAIPAGMSIAGFVFNYNETTGDSSVDWTRPNHGGYSDCGGYRLEILAERKPLHVAHLPAGTSSFSIPRESELGREIEAMVKDPNERVLNLALRLRPGAGATSIQSGLTTRGTTLNETAPMTMVTETVTAPFLLHPATPPATLPAIVASDTSITCGYTSTGNDEVQITFTHRPGTTTSGWTLIGYYTQLFYPPNYDVDLGRLFGWIDILEDGHEYGSSAQGFFDDPQRFVAEAHIGTVYEKDGRRLAGTVRTIRCNGIPDAKAPLLLSAVVDGPVLTLTYDEELDGAHVPDKSAFTVTGSSRTVQSVALDDRAVTLTLGPPVTQGETVRLTYTLPTDTDDRLQDYFRNEAAAIDQLVTNNTGDTTLPVFQSASLDGTKLKLTLTYNEPLDSNSRPAGSAFNVQVESVRRTVNSVSVSGTSVELTLASAVEQGESVTFSYTAPNTNPIQDTSGNDAADLTDESVDNDDTIPPVFQSAEVDWRDADADVQRVTWGATT